MLNLSEQRVDKHISTNDYSSFSMLENFVARKILNKILIIGFVLFLVIMFLPWTQNIRSNGIVTVLQPDKRPQTIQSVIGGKIEKWYVREGDYVKRGDTILYLLEIKDEYFDPNILGRTEKQIKAKELSVSSFMEKIKSIDNQIDALAATQLLKIEQAKNKLIQSQLKIQSDSIEYIAEINNYNIAKLQLERTQKLYEEGLKSLTDLETKKIKLQETQAKRVSTENKLISSRNEYLNVKMELVSIQNQYNEMLAKSEADKYSTLSSMYEAEAEVTRMQSKYSGYTVRTGLYYITAPQDGYITKAIKTGIGENVKEGEELISIAPVNYRLAVEMFVNPVDLPLVKTGQHVRIIFDGWPSIVFSGWPNSSYGTFGGTVVAIDNFTSPNGKYRILVSEDKNDTPWPKEIRPGAGAVGMALLKDVSIGYEIWRKLNGFPPDYYEATAAITNEAQKKK